MEHLIEIENREKYCTVNNISPPVTPYTKSIKKNIIIFSIY